MTCASISNRPRGKEVCKKMHWKLKVSGYEKIKSAEIETAPLTLFVGDNNSGKSYLPIGKRGGKYDGHYTQ